MLRTRLFFGVGGLVALLVAVSVFVLFGTSRLGATLIVAILAGALAAWVSTRILVASIDARVRPITEAAKELEQGNLSARARIGRDEDVGQVGAALDRFAESVAHTVTELRAERDLVSRILNGMEEGVLLLDDDGKVALTNPALREMLLLRADGTGKPLLEVVRHAELKEILDRARRTRSTAAGEIEVAGLKPSRLLVRATSFSGRAELGEGLVVVFFDVTDIRRLESLRRDFVANVSHELRTPVTAIASAAETLETALTRDPPAAERFVEIIVRNAARLHRLIEDLLDLSRIESRELKLRPERLAFEPFANHLIGMFRERADKKRIQLGLSGQATFELVTDRRALEQVLTNLIDNAVKYCPPESSVVLRVERRAAGDVRLLVEDDGPGIAEKDLPRLFERFYRVDAGRSREMGGTGLGLSIAKHLVEALGGTIDVASAVGKGTTFEVILPGAAPKPKERSSGDVTRAADEDAA